MTKKKQRIKDEHNVNLWTYYYHVTIIPPILAAICGLIALIYYRTDEPTPAIVWSAVTATILLPYLFALIIWTFSKRGSPTHWTVVIDGPSGKILRVSEPERFLLPRLTIQGENGEKKELLAYWKNDLPFWQQLVFGPPDYEREELGFRMKGYVEYTQMTQPMIDQLANAPLGYQPCRVDDPLNVGTTKAQPKLKVDVHTDHPRHIIEYGGLSHAGGQLADPVTMYYQALVAGMSPAFINVNAEKIARQLDKHLENELKSRGLAVEKENGFVVVDHGLPEDIRGEINRRTVEEQRGIADNTAKQLAADGEAHKARGAKTAADAVAYTITQKGEAEAAAIAAALKARFDAMLAAGIPKTKIGDILRQEAAPYYPVDLPDGVRDIIFGGATPSIYRASGGDDPAQGAARDAAKTKTKAGDGKP